MATGVSRDEGRTGDGEMSAKCREKHACECRDAFFTAVHFIIASFPILRVPTSSRLTTTALTVR